MIKKQIEKKIRLTILTVLIVILIFAAYNTFLVYQKPVTQEKQVPFYNYTQLGKTGYRVLLKPNNLYPGPVLEAGGIYLANFIDKIEAVFTYQFNGDQDARIYGAYSVSATLEAYDTSKQKSIKIWEKTFPLLEQKRFEFQGRSASFTESVFLDFPYYSQFLEAVNKASGITAGEAKLVVKCEIFTKAQTSKGTAEDSLIPSLTVPVGSRAFEIQPVPVKEKRGMLGETKTFADLKTIRERQVFSAVSIVLFIIVLIFGLATTSKPVVVDLEKKMLATIWRKHGERIVKAVEKTVPETEKTVHLNSLDDLIKVADELSRPIFYEPRSGTGMHLFYIFDGYFRYECTLSVDVFYQKLRDLRNSSSRPARNSS